VGKKKKKSNKFQSMNDWNCGIMISFRVDRNGFWWVIVN